jgi:hypothetical protein
MKAAVELLVVMSTSLALGRTRRILTLLLVSILFLILVMLVFILVHIVWRFVFIVCIQFGIWSSFCIHGSDVGPLEMLLGRYRCVIYTDHSSL